MRYFVQIVFVSIGVVLLETSTLVSTNKRVDVWRQALCEKQVDDQFDETELFNDTRQCYKLKSQTYQDAMSECATEALPDSEGDPFVVMSRGCRNDTIFQEFDECFQKYEADQDFVNQSQLSEAEKNCFVAVVQKHGLQIGGVGTNA